MRGFAGQTVLVTGGNKGIGRGTASRFAQEWAKVAIPAIDAGTVDIAAQIAQDTGAAVLGMLLDVTDSAAIKASVSGLSGAVRLHPHAAICGLEIWRAWFDPKSGKGTGARGGTVNAIGPGMIHTDMWDHSDRVWGQMLGDYGPSPLMAEWVRGIPVGRTSTAAEVAALVAFLASAEAAYITGQSINVDCGLILS